jgi:hypothetical protein
LEKVWWLSLGVERSPVCGEALRSRVGQMGTEAIQRRQECFDSFKFKKHTKFKKKKKVQWNMLPLMAESVLGCRSITLALQPSGTESSTYLFVFGAKRMKEDELRE